MVSPGSLRVEPLWSRERPDDQLAALFAGGWPAFIGADELAAAHLPAVRSTFADLELVLLHDDVPVAAGWGVPLVWDATIAGLPGGYSDSLRRAVVGHEEQVVPDTLVICAAQVRADVARGGLAMALLDGLIAAGAGIGLSKVIAPLRPTAKHHHPLVPIEEYAGWTGDDGRVFDPWVRTHVRMGAEVVATGPASQTFTGTIDQWRSWTGLELAGDGDHIVPEALAPLSVDHAADRGICVEPTIWVRHR